jgi:hypothetical protein
MTKTHESPFFPSLSLPTNRKNHRKGLVESKVLSQLRRLSKLFVVDGFDDKTLENALRLKVSGSRLSNQQGQRPCYQIRHVQKLGKIIAFIDAGMDIDPRTIYDFRTFRAV